MPLSSFAFQNDSLPSWAEYIHDDSTTYLSIAWQNNLFLGDVVSLTQLVIQDTTTRSLHVIN